ncbi:hypothetical protein XH90_03475 [Bradyrhizobium sp. CCBAU 53338]|nr:hypothetical protein XH90_03475 [Bradyrhizobium sp. CCBAU 53338]
MSIGGRRKQDSWLREKQMGNKRAEKRGEIVRYLEDALALADEIDEGETGYLIERALDEARSQQSVPSRNRSG